MRTLPILFGALLLLFPAFNNGYPFLYADTSTYITGGFLGAVSDFRPITYGLFVRHISLMESLWLVAFVQALILSALIHLVFRVFSSDEPGIRPLVTIAALTLTTHIGITTGMLMPDFLTPAAVLSTGIFLIILLGVGGYWAWQRWRVRSAFRPRRFDAIRDAMPDQLPAIRNSKQYSEQWDNHFLDIFQRFAVLLGFLVFAAVLWRPTRVQSTPALRRLAAFLLLALLANALVCGGVSMVDMRFQARVIWLVPLFATLFFWEWYDTRRSAQST